MSSLERPLLTIGEGCEYLGLSRSTIYRLVADGELRLIKVYSRSLLARCNLDAYVDRLLTATAIPSQKASMR